MILRAAYVAAVLAIACAATTAASFAPISDPTTAWGACIAAGHIGLLVALAWLPCPCHRKDHR